MKAENDSAKEESLDEDDQKLVIKEEPEFDQNNSTASSCDYNMSQFKEDESRFDGMDEESRAYDDDGDYKSDVKDEPMQDDDSDEDKPLVSATNLHFHIFTI